jgi:hypothetical protein
MKMATPTLSLVRLLDYNDFQFSAIAIPIYIKQMAALSDQGLKEERGDCPLTFKTTISKGQLPVKHCRKSNHHESVVY